MGQRKKKAIVYGTGGTAQFYVREDMNPEELELTAFADGNESKQGTWFLDKPVLSPEQIKNSDFDVVIIASVFYEEIRQRLLQEGIPEEKIQSRYDGQLPAIQQRYQDFYEKKGKKKKDSGHITLRKNEKIVVCTAITGRYDELREPLFQDERLHYVCYTDDTTLVSDTWEIRKLPAGSDDNRNAKKIKVLTHQYLPEYDWSIWVDGKFQITGDLIQLLNCYAVNSHFLSFMHYRRNSVYADAQVIKREGFDLPEIVDRQMARYREAGFADDNELLEGGVLFKKHNEPEIIRLMNAWWYEIEHFSRRDQLSFNFCTWKEKVFCDMIDLNIYDNKYVRAFPHNRKKDRREPGTNENTVRKPLVEK